MTSIEEYQPPELSLSDLAGKYDLNVVRDGKFRYLGKIPTLLPEMLVPAGAEKFLSELPHSQGAKAVLVPPDLVEAVPEEYAVASCDDPIGVLFRIHTDLCKTDHYWGAPRKTEIGKNVSIHPSATVADHNVIIGDNVRIEENAVIRPYSVIGDGCLIGPGTVISCEGFQTATLDGQQLLLPQSGGVRLGRNVSVLALATITRSTFGGFTELHDDVVVDNLTQIAHDVIIGAQTRIAAGAVVSGRVQIGRKVLLAPNVTISNGVHVGNNATVTLGSVVINNVPDGETVTGNFAVKHMKFMKDMAKRFFL